MNIRDLAIKLKNIEENQQIEPANECGEMMPVMHAEQPKQPDNVNMNITMSGNGAGGIRDLMSILRDLESKGDAEILSTEPAHDNGTIIIGDDQMEEEYANSPHPHKQGLKAVTATGDDLASKGHVHPHKVNGGENPMREGLVRRLQGLYEEIKEQGVAEGSEWPNFGSRYAEELAQKVFDQNPNLNTSGRADELLNAAFPIMVQDLGSRKRANYYFNYDEDFPSDFVSAYGWLQDGIAESGPYDLGKEYGAPAPSKKPLPHGGSIPRRHPDDPDFMDPDQRRFHADQARVKKAQAEYHAKKK